MPRAHRITTRPSERQVRVESGGQVLAESNRAIELDETGLPTRFYLPREDVRMDLLTPTDTTSLCPFKGDASYFSAPGADGRVLGLRGAVGGGREADRGPARAVAGPGRRLRRRREAELAHAHGALGGAGGEPAVAAVARRSRSATSSPLVIRSVMVQAPLLSFAVLRTPATVTVTCPVAAFAAAPRSLRVVVRPRRDAVADVIFSPAAALAGRTATPPVGRAASSGALAGTSAIGLVGVTAGGVVSITKSVSSFRRDRDVLLARHDRVGAVGERLRGVGGEPAALPEGGQRRTPARAGDGQRDRREIAFGGPGDAFEMR